MSSFGCWLQVTKIGGDLIGCVNATTNACPVVAFRSSGANFAMERCVDTTSCPAFSTVPGSSNTQYTVPALAVGASVPTACLTMGAVQTCPDQDNLRFPIEVMFGEPMSPVCGSNNPICQNVRAVQCLAVNSTCPSNYNLRVFRNPTVPSSVPTLVECRQARASCDLTATGMTSTDPNNAAYTIPALTGDALDGCIVSGSTACPAAYPFNLTTNGVLTACGTAVPPPPPPPQPLACNATTQIPLRSVNGNVVGCQNIFAPGSTTPSPCPAAHPISLRKDTSGNLGGCMAIAATCPTDYNFLVYGFLAGQAAAGIAADALTLTNCWATGVVASCSFINIDGVAYNVPIMSSATGTERTLGCVIASAKACPAAFPFGYLDMETPGTRAIPALNKCFPAGEITACQAPAVATANNPSPTLTFSKPAYNGTALAACLKGSFSGANVNGQCPDDCRTVVLFRLDPAVAFSSNAAQADAETIGCWNTTTCANTPQPFALFNVQGAVTRPYCVPQPIGLQSCGSYSVATYRDGAGLYTTNGATLIGCTNTKVCPNTFPIYFKTSAAAADSTRCQASLSVPCSAIANGGWPVSVTNSTGSVVGCVNAVSTCSNNQVPLTTAAVGGTIQGCSDVTTRCADPNFAAQTATDCNGAAFDTFNIEVFGNAAGTGNVVGCMSCSA
jgi:hypothetical protein